MIKDTLIKKDTLFTHNWNSIDKFVFNSPDMIEKKFFNSGNFIADM